MFSVKVDENIELRLFDEKYAEESFSVVQENYEHLHTFLHWATEDNSVEKTREAIRQSRIDFAKNEGISCLVFYQGKIIGAIALMNINRDSKRAEIGYWLAKQQQGKGIITKCCRVLIEYAFGELEMNRIEIRCATENKRSCAIPERLGFTLEGVLRQSEWRHTQFFDMAVYSVLKEDWKN